MKVLLVSLLAVASLAIVACDDKKPDAPAKPAATSTGAAANTAAPAKSAAPGGGW
jgi:uncharacterized lipoprotein YbaY